MSRTAVVHIGDQKAGSKTIQRFISENERLLEARGVRRNRSTLFGNYHSGLASMAMHARRFGNVEFKEWGIGDGGDPDGDMERHRAEMKKRLAKEMATLPPRIKTVLFSHEGLLLRDAEETARVAELLKPHFDRVIVVAYLRRQDRVAVSAYSTLLRSAHHASNNAPSLSLISDPPPIRDYAAALDAWAQAFGEEALRVRIFHRDEFSGGELLPDFIAAAELGTPEGFAAVPPQNESLTPSAQAFLRAINDHLPGVLDGQRNPRRQMMLAILSEIASGTGHLPSRVAARWHYRRHRKINEAVRKRWFPERATLFDDNFQEYPMFGRRTPTFADTSPLVGGLLTLFADRLRHSQMETLIARGDLARAQKRVDASKSAYQRAMRLLPEAAAPHLALARSLLAWGELDAAEASIAEALKREPDSARAAELTARIARRRKADAAKRGGKAGGPSGEGGGDLGQAAVADRAATISSIGGESSDPDFAGAAPVSTSDEAAAAAHG